MKKIDLANKNAITKDLIGYLSYSPVSHCFVSMKDFSIEEFNLKIYADKKMRRSIVNNIIKGTFDVSEKDDKIVLSSPSVVKISDSVGVKIKINNIFFLKSDLTEYKKQPKEVQRTAKEQADYLFGMLITEVGGAEWVKEQSWIARVKNLIHNNNKGDVSYTRLNIMLNRCLRIYNQFSNTKGKRSKKNEN